MLCKRCLERSEVTHQERDKMAQGDSFRGQNNGPNLQRAKGEEKEML